MRKYQILNEQLLVSGLMSEDDVRDIIILIEGYLMTIGHITTKTIS